MSRRLTPRQREVLEAVADGGRSYQEVADHLGISRNTVRNHLAAAMTAYGAQSVLRLLWLLGMLRPQR